MEPFDREARALRRFLRLADAFSSSPLLQSGKAEEISFDRRELPMEAIRLASDFLSQFEWPILPLLTYHGMRTATRDEKTPVAEADAQMVLTALVVTTSGVKREIEVPIFVRKNKLLEPSIAIVDGQPRILAQSLVDELITSGTFMKKVDPRGGMFAPPLDKDAREMFLEMDEKLKEQEQVSRHMFSVEASKTAAQPRVDQVLNEVAKLQEQGYSGVDIMLKVHQSYPQIAEAVMETAKEQGLLDDLE